MDGWMEFNDSSIHEGKVEPVDGWMDRWEEESMDGRMERRRFTAVQFMKTLQMDEWMDGWVNEWIMFYGLSVDGDNAEPTNERMDRWS